MKSNHVNTLINSLKIGKSKIEKESFLIMIQADKLKKVDVENYLQLAIENKIIKNLRANNDSKNMLSFRANYLEFCKEQEKQGILELDKENPNKPRYVLYDKNNDRRSVDLNMSNIDARIRKATSKEQGNLNVSVESAEKFASNVKE
jgi:hypothetical protein